MPIIDMNKIGDIIPLDYTVNALISVMWWIPLTDRVKYVQ